jgi:hypothetical protein
MAQDSAQNAVSAMALPDGNGAWLVRVFTYGGLTGSGIGDFGLSSAGQVVCSPGAGKCSQTFEAGRIQPLVDMAAVKPADAAPPWPFCSDCVTRRLIILRRDSTGSVQSLSFFWTDVTPRVPREVVDLYNAVIKAARAEPN